MAGAELAERSRQMRRQENSVMRGAGRASSIHRGMSYLSQKVAAMTF
jgi:hypothetical protein